MLVKLSLQIQQVSATEVPQVRGAVSVPAWRKQPYRTPESQKNQNPSSNVIGSMHGGHSTHQIATFPRRAAAPLLPHAPPNAPMAEGMQLVRIWQAAHIRTIQPAITIYKRPEKMGDLRFGPDVYAGAPVGDPVTFAGGIVSGGGRPVSSRHKTSQDVHVGKISPPSQNNGNRPAAVQAAAVDFSRSIGDPGVIQVFFAHVPSR